jgi:hypothetical protein
MLVVVLPALAYSLTPSMATNMHLTERPLAVGGFAYPLTLPKS